MENKRKRRNGGKEGSRDKQPPQRAMYPPFPSTHHLCAPLPWLSEDPSHRTSMEASVGRTQHPPPSSLGPSEDPPSLSGSLL